MLTDGLECCGLLWCFYQLFGLSFWRHPFTAEHSLLSKRCSATFLQTWWRNKLIYILDGLRVRTFSANFTFCVNCQTSNLMYYNVNISSASFGFFAQGGSSCYRTKVKCLIPHEVDLWSGELQRSALFCSFTSTEHLTWHYCREMISLSLCFLSTYYSK